MPRSGRIERIFRIATAVFTEKGFEWSTPQLELFPSSDSHVSFLADLVLPRHGRALVRVFAATQPQPSAEAISYAKTSARAASIPLVALTSDGRRFRTLLASGNGGSLPYLPRAPLHGAGHYRAITSLEDTFPFTSILDLRRVVTRLADSLYAASGSDRLQLFETTLALLTIKLYDELKFPRGLKLPSVFSSSQHVDERLDTLYRSALKHFGVARFMPPVRFNDQATVDALRSLLPYSFTQTIQLGSHAEILGTFYQEIVSSTFRGSLGAYFTPKPIADLAVALCDPTSRDTVFDISCGSGTFLLSAYSLGRNRAEDIGPRLFGCDIQARMVLTSILNCVIHGVRDHHFIHRDGLRLDLPDWNRRDPAVPRGGFTLVVGNPPFAGFESNASGTSAVMPPQRGTAPRVHKVIPFVERVLELLTPGGRAALVIPTSVLNGEAASFRTLRSRLGANADVTAIVGLPKESFVHTDCGVEGALLFFSKRQRPAQDSTRYTFFARVSDIGYDRRGRPTSRTDVASVVQAWKNRDINQPCWIPTGDLLGQDRWDPPWLEAYRRGTLRFSDETHVRLTELCEVVSRPLERGKILPNGDYLYFEVGDTDLNTGELLHTHRCSGTELIQKGRLRLQLEGGEVLLPNHRDSLIAKTAASYGRSAVWVPDTFSGVVTSDRFTPLASKIDPRVLVVLLNSRLVRHQLVLRSRGSASFDIRDKVLDEVWVPRMVVTDQALGESVVQLWARREALAAELKGVMGELQEIIP